MTEIL